MRNAEINANVERPADTSNGSQLDCRQFGQRITTDKSCNGIRSMKVGDIFLAQFGQMSDN